MKTKETKETAAFIREHRSNESNFEKLCEKLREEAGRAGGDYKNMLEDTMEKEAEEYRKAKEGGGSAWPEFEKFVSSFERAVVGALNGT